MDTAGTGLPKTNLIPTNAWTHVVASYDGDTIRIYQNGALIQSAASPGVANYPAGGKFRIGGSFFRGWVDEVAMYDRALTPAQVAALTTSTPMMVTQTGGTSLSHPEAPGWGRRTP